MQPNAAIYAKAPAHGSGWKKWGEGVGVKDSTDEFESLLNEIDTHPSAYSKKVGVKGALSLVFNVTLNSQKTHLCEWKCHNNGSVL